MQDLTPLSDSSDPAPWLWRGAGSRPPFPIQDPNRHVPLTGASVPAGTGRAGRPARLKAKKLIIQDLTQFCVSGKRLVGVLMV